MQTAQIIVKYVTQWQAAGPHSY